MADYTCAFWNLENLFAPEDYPDRESWIRDRLASELRGWSEELFARKVGQLAAGISAMAGGAGPDLLGVCEVENRFVLEALTDELANRLPGREYQVVHADSARDRRGIDTAFLFDARVFAVDPSAVFSHWVVRRTGTRDITQATFTTRDTDHDLVALTNHWPSRSGGAVESAGFRAVAGETLGYWHERIREVRGENVSVLAFGDFNDDPWDPSIRFNANSSRERGDVERTRTARFYNLAWSYARTQPAIDHRGHARTIDGTLYHEGEGNVFDQVLVNRSLVTGEGGLSVRDDLARIELHPPMVDHRVRNGPLRFGLPKGDPERNVNVDGYSDHFPVSIVVTEG